LWLEINRYYEALTSLPRRSFIQADLVSCETVLVKDEEEEEEEEVSS
jgi:hypothetical protein